MCEIHLQELNLVPTLNTQKNVLRLPAGGGKGTVLKQPELLSPQQGLSSGVVPRPRLLECYQGKYPTPAQLGAGRGEGN